MHDSHVSSDYLREIWRELNTSCFSSRLVEPSSIGWIDLSREPDLTEEFGYYFPHQNGIALSHRFKYAEAQHTACEKLATDPSLSMEQRKAELEKFNAGDIVYRLMIHEMIHQSAHQSGESASSHGATFLKHAQGVAAALDIPVPTSQDAHQWPSIQHFLALEVAAGHVSA